MFSSSDRPRRNPNVVARCFRHGSVHECSALSDKPLFTLNSMEVASEHTPTKMTKLFALDWFALGMCTSQPLWYLHLIQYSTVLSWNVPMQQHQVWCVVRNTPKTIWHVVHEIPQTWTLRLYIMFNCYQLFMIINHNWSILIMNHHHQN